MSDQIPTLKDLTSHEDFRALDTNGRLEVFDGWSSSVTAQGVKSGGLDPSDPDYQSFISNARGAIELQARFENPETSFGDALTKALVTQGANRQFAGATENIALADQAREELRLLEGVEEGSMIARDLPGAGDTSFPTNNPQPISIPEGGEVQTLGDTFNFVLPPGSTGGISREEFQRRKTRDFFKNRYLARKKIAASTENSTLAEEAYPTTESIAKFNNSKTFTEAFDAFFENPGEVSRSLGGDVVSSAAAPVAAGRAGAATGNPAVSFMAAGGVAIEQEFASALKGYLIEEGEALGYDTSTDKGLFQAMLDKRVLEASEKKAVKRGAIIGSVDGLTQGLATALGKKFGWRVLANVVVDPAGGAIGEASAQIATGEDLAPGAIIAEGLGGLGGGAASTTIDGAAAGVNKISGRSKAAPEGVKPEAAPEAPESGDPDQSLTNDPFEEASDKIADSAVDRSDLDARAQLFYRSIEENIDGPPEGSLDVGTVEEARAQEAFSRIQDIDEIIDRDGLDEATEDQLLLERHELRQAIDDGGYDFTSEQAEMAGLEAERQRLLSRIGLAKETMDRIDIDSAEFDQSPEIQQDFRNASEERDNAVRDLDRNANKRRALTGVSEDGRRAVVDTSGRPSAFSSMSDALQAIESHPDGAVLEAREKNGRIEITQPAFNSREEATASIRDAQEAVDLAPTAQEARAAFQNKKKVSNAAARAYPTPSPDVLGMPLGSNSAIPTAPRQNRRVSPITAPEVMESYVEILSSLQSNAGLRVGHTNRQNQGQFESRPEVVAMREANDIVNAPHEVAHAIEKAMGVTWEGMDQATADEVRAIGEYRYPGDPPQNGHFSEGFADFVAGYIQNRQEAQAAAPKFFKVFEESILPRNPKLGAALDSASEAYSNFFNQSAKDRVSGSIADNDSLGRKIKTKAREVKNRIARIPDDFIESLLPFKAVDRIAGVHGMDGIYDNAKATRKTSDAVTAHMVDRGMLDFYGNITGISLREAISPIGSRRRDFMVYLFARRAQSLHQEATETGTLRNPGISLEDANSVFSELDSPEFSEAATNVYRWQDQVLDYVSQASPEFAQAIDRARESDPGNFIPLSREFSVLASKYRSSSARQSGSTPYQRLKGSARRIKSPFKNIVATAAQMIRRSHDRNILDRLLDLSQENDGLGDFIREVEPGSSLAARKTVGELVKSIERVSGDSISIEDADAAALREIVDVYTVSDPKPGERPIFAATVQGVQKYYEVSEDVYTALANLHPSEINQAFGLAGAVMRFTARTARLGNTGLRATFSFFTAPIRGLPEAYVNTRYQHNPISAIAGYLGAYTSSLVSAISAGRLDTKTQKLFKQLSINVSQPLAPDSRGVDSATRNLGRGLVMKTIDPRNVYDFIADVFQAPDRAGRVTEMKAALKEAGWDGKSPLTGYQTRAAQLAAKEVGTDFSSGGKKGEVLNQYIPYFNASVQGPRATSRALLRNPIAVLVKGAGLMALSLWAWSQNKDEEWWLEMPASDRYKNSFFKIGGTVYRVPRPFEIGGFFMALPEAIFDAAYQAAQDDPARQSQIIEWVEAFARTSAPPIEPPIFSTILDQASGDGGVNRYSGTPIVSKRLQGLPDDEQFTDYTTKASVALGEAFDMSPLRIEHTIRKIGGGAAVDALALGGRVDSNDSNSGPLGFAQLSNNFPAQPVSITKFYDLLEGSEERRRSQKTPETPIEEAARKQLAEAKRAIDAIWAARRDQEGKVADKLKLSAVQIARQAVKEHERIMAYK